MSGFGREEYFGEKVAECEKNWKRDPREIVDLKTLTMIPVSLFDDRRFVICLWRLLIDALDRNRGNKVCMEVQKWSGESCERGRWGIQK
jgi:hypothetical protein